MANLNKVMLMGNITRDLELTYLPEPDRRLRIRARRQSHLDRPGRRQERRSDVRRLRLLRQDGRNPRQVQEEGRSALHRRAPEARPMAGPGWDQALQDAR